MKKYYLSKNYNELSSAGNKAKTDIENILSDLDYQYAGLAQTSYKNKLVGFLVTLIGVLKVPFTVSQGSILVVQYPLKKYYSLVCRMAHLRGCKVVTLIHDLGAFRRKKLTVSKEIKRLSNSDALIVHNDSMKDWLTGNGYKKPMVCLEIFDYLSSTEAKEKTTANTPYSVIYAGGLSYKKNRFLYVLDELIHSWHFNLYGNGFEWERIRNKEHFSYKGFVPSDELIATAEGEFGLVWDGESATTCSGAFGEYLRYNNPHKTSLYIRCHLPVIIWKKAALAGFIEKNKIGITVSSLEELGEILGSVTSEQYAEMRQNIIQVSDRLSSGYYFTHALTKAISFL